ncbi:MAG: VWA domain-containing protein [Dehalococcoidia bacterium]|nr:VWA domain-containing protein [Dehalococcoidia bacterium]
MSWQWQDYRLADPWLLLLALLIPAVLLLAAYTRGRGSALGFTRVSALTYRGGMRRALRWLPDALRLLAVLALVIAVARPQLGRADASVQAEGIDIVLVLDASGSMSQRDFASSRTRLEVAQEVIRKFIERQTDDRIALVAFQGNAEVLSPLTLDHDPLLRLVTDAGEIQFTGGTAIGLATAEGINLLIDSRAKSRIVVLLTDGENNAGAIEPIQAARLAEAVGVRLYTVGVRGSEQNDLDEATLEKMAEIGGGTYSGADNQQALEQSYARIGDLEKSQVTRNRFLLWDDLAPAFLAAAAAALMLEVLLRSTVFRRIP